jgi:hypothetical protein
MVPFWAYTELGPAPILVSMYLVATLVQMILFIALMIAAQVSPNVCLPSGWLLAEHHIIIHSTQHTFLYITFMHNIHTFFFTCLLFFLAGWLPLALDVRYSDSTLLKII